MGTYTVEYISAAGVFTDISDFVHTLDDTCLYSDGRISTSALTLQANFGQFITDDRGGSTPIIEQFDRIRLTYLDSDGLGYQHIFEVVNDLGQTTRQSEYLLPLTLEGRERNLAFIPFSGFFDPPISHFEVSQKILSVYGGSKKSIQPTMLDTVNQLPTFNPNFWDFQYIDNCLDALKEVLRVANLSVAAGGGGDRFAMVFEDVPGDLSIMNLSFISQGSANAGQPFVTITGDPVYNPIQVIDKVKQPVTGTVNIARGRPGSGGTPREGDLYRSRLEFYQTIPPYDSTTTYPPGAYVMFGSQITNPELTTGQIYQADVETTGNLPTNALFWSLVSAATYIGTFNYSLLTKDKATLYRNECTNPSNAFDSDTESSPKMLDCNIVIEDVETKRDWVYFRSNTDVVGSLSADQTNYLFEGTDYYPGFRILVDVSNLGTGAGSFDPTLDAFGTGAGNDPNGKPYANNAVIRIDDTWFVIKEHDDFDQILSRLDGLFEWNVNFVSKSRFPASDTNNANRRYRQAAAGTPDGWRALGEQFLANDCLHSPSSITNIDGLVTPVSDDMGGFYSDDSAVRIIYEYNAVDETPDERNILDQIIGLFATQGAFLTTFAANALIGLYNLFLTPEYRNAGWWITLTTPWPFNTANGITEEVGGIIGGQSLIELNNHAFFDAYNQRVAYSGKAGFNETDSQDLMEITGVSFLYRLDIQANGTTIPFTGEIPCSYWALDDNGTIWKQKKTYRLLNDVQIMTFDFGDFSPVYRARSPFGISNIVTNILVPELEVKERLFPSRIKMQGFMLELSYDEHGRYLPNIMETIIKPTIFNMFDPGIAGVNVQFIGDIDYFQWVKTPIAIEDGSTLGVTPDRVIFPEIKDYPNISNFEQLRRAAIADFTTEFFQYEQYTLTQNDRGGNNLQDTVYLREQYLIPNNDQTASLTNAWSSLTQYFPNDVVNVGGSVTWNCIKPALGASEGPPNAEFWELIADGFVTNTRELTVGEISLSVTDGKDWERNMTLIRRIPQVVA